MNGKKIFVVIQALILLIFMIGCAESNHPEQTQEDTTEIIEENTEVTTEEKTEATTEENEDNIENIEELPEKGYMAPDFTFMIEKGEESTLFQLRGKPVFLNFWASWCPYCKAELPSIQNMYEKYKDKIQFITVNARDEKEKGEKVISGNNYTFPVVYDEENTIIGIYRIQPIPMNIFIDSQGKIVEKVLGKIEEQELERYLLLLLEEK